MSARRTIAALALAGALCSPCGAASEIDATVRLALEMRGYAQSPASDAQFDGVQWGLVLSPEIRWSSEDGATRFLFEPYLRSDTRDARRNYGDIRELSLQYRRDSADLLIGISRVAWGVAESRNVVDVINQIDALEDIDEGEKLGQPMIRVSRQGASGAVELYWLPYFRERRFPSESGRLRATAVVDGSDAVHTREGGRSAGDVALRMRHSSRRLDLGLHAFHGTDRSPRLDPSADGDRPALRYVALRQVGIDAQWTFERLLVKTELIRGRSGGAAFTAWVAGIEYGLYGVLGSSYDVGLVLERLHDDRRDRGLPITVFDDDHFAGIRITGNDMQDTELLIGAVVDRDTGGVLGALEFQRRLGSAHLLEVELRMFDAQRDRMLAGLDRDDTLLVRLTRFF